MGELLSKRRHHAAEHRGKKSGCRTLPRNAGTIQPQPACSPCPREPVQLCPCPRPQDVHYSSLASAFELFLEALGEQELPLPQKLNSGQQDGRLLALAGTAAVSSTATAGPRHGAGDRVHQVSAENPMSIHCQVPRSKGRGQMWKAPHLRAGIWLIWPKARQQTSLSCAKLIITVAARQQHLHTGLMPHIPPTLPRRTQDL